MAIIRPYTEFDTEAEITQNSTNYPGLKHFFQIKEAAAATEITDAISGGTVAATVSAGPDSASKLCAITANTDFTGTYPSLAGTVTVCLSLEDDAGAAGVVFGDSTSGTYIRFELSNAGKYYDGGGGDFADITWTAVSTGKLAMRAIVIDAPNDKVYAYEYDGTFNDINAAGIAIATGTGPTYDAPASKLSNNNPTGEIYGTAMLQLSDRPVAAEMKAAMAWMYDSWKANNKVIYPGWIGRS